MRNALAAFCLIPGFAFANCTEDAMLVFDASASMQGVLADPARASRIDEAREALRRALPDVTYLRRLGLIVYGPGETSGCSHVEVHFPPIADAAGPIMNVIDRVWPDGNTAMVQAVAAAAEVLAKGTAHGTIVLVTDGEETCGGETCDLATTLAESYNVTVHVIGFQLPYSRLRADGVYINSGVGSEPIESHCLAAQTGGLYVSAETIDELVAALYLTLWCRLSS